MNNKYFKNKFSNKKNTELGAGQVTGERLALSANREFF